MTSDDLRVLFISEALEMLEMVDVCLCHMCFFLSYRNEKTRQESHSEAPFEAAQLASSTEATAASFTLPAPRRSCAEGLPWTVKVS